MNKNSLPIYYVELTVTYRHGKKEMTKDVWCMSHSTDVLDIMDDPLSISTMERQIYSSTYKSEKRITIKKVRTWKQLGMTNHNK
jgi:hypothetical protein